MYNVKAWTHLQPAPKMMSNLSADTHHVQVEWNYTTRQDQNDSCLDSLEPDTALYRFIVNGVLLNLVGVLGILGNVISMIILSRPQMRSSINYLLIGLARIDTVLIVTSILLFGLPGIYPYTGLMFTYFYNVYPRITQLVYPMAMVVQTASVYLTLTVSLERFVAVCHPLRARSLCTYGRARVYVIGIIIFSIVYNLPRLFEGTVISEFYEQENITVYCVRPTQLRMNSLFIEVYVQWCYLVFLYLIPFGCLAVLNAAIYRQVRKANRERQLLSRIQRREIGLATMLLCVVVVFFICNFPPLVANSIETFNLTNSSIVDQIINTSNLLVTINSSVNFIIYVIFGEKFKRLFLILFCSNGLFSSGRESPDGATHDDSFISNGDRQSVRLYRQNTGASRNGFSVRNGSSRDNWSNRSRTPVHSFCVYYKPNQQGNNKEISGYTAQTSLPNGD